MNVDVGLFADSEVGCRLLRFLLVNHRSHITYVVVTNAKSQAYSIAKKYGVDRIVVSEDITSNNASSMLANVDYIFLLWWPKVIGDHIINSAKVGVVNTHPSFLPYNRGKHYNFWALVEDSPFGVSLHFVDSGVDTGDILYQEPIAKTWEDTGGTLYYKAQDEICRIFEKKYTDIVSGNYQRKVQNIKDGSFHFSSELETTSLIDLNDVYTVKDLLNLLRARTFEGYPACSFLDGGKKYEVRVKITEVKE